MSERRRALRARAGMIGMALLAGACATEPPSQTLGITSNPPGARCDVAREGTVVGSVTAPGAVRVVKTNRDLVVTCRKDGYADGSALANSRVDGGHVAAGFILLGVIGGVQALSSDARYYDAEIAVSLNALPPGAAPPIAAASVAPASTSAAPAGRFDAPVGETYRDVIEVGAIQVPLPDGTWQLAGKGLSENSSGNHAISLVRIENGRLWGVVRIWTEFQPGRSAGYASFRPCERADLIFKTVASNVDRGAQDCWLVNHNMVQENRTNATELHIQQGYGFIEQRGVPLPATVINATHRFAGPSNFLTVWYLVNPEVFGYAGSTAAAWKDSEWHRDRLAADAPRNRFVEAVKQFHGDYHEHLRRGFERQLAGFTSRPFNAAASAALEAPPQLGSRCLLSTPAGTRC